MYYNSLDWDVIYEFVRDFLYLSQEVERLKSAVAEGGVSVDVLFIMALELKYGLGRDESNIPDLLLSA